METLKRKNIDDDDDHQGSAVKKTKAETFKDLMEDLKTHVFLQMAGLEHTLKPYKYKKENEVYWDADISYKSDNGSCLTLNKHKLPDRKSVV